MKTITLSKEDIQEKEGVVVLPLKKWEEIEKENIELHSAIEYILEGELALHKKQTRTLRVYKIRISSVFQKSLNLIRNKNIPWAVN